MTIWFAGSKTRRGESVIYGLIILLLVQLLGSAVQPLLDYHCIRLQNRRRGGARAVTFAVEFRCSPLLISFSIDT